MKSGIHPRYEPVVFRDRSSGEMFLSRSTRIPQETVELDGQTYPVIHVEISSTSHPFWTGQRREMDSEGRVERFRRRYGRVGSTQAGTDGPGDGVGDGAAAGESA